MPTRSDGDGAAQTAFATGEDCVLAQRLLIVRGSHPIGQGRESPASGAALSNANRSHHNGFVRLASRQSGRWVTSSCYSYSSNRSCRVKQESAPTFSDAVIHSRSFLSSWNQRV